MTGVVVAIVAAFTPISVLVEMVSIGTLFAFVLVCGAAIYLRRSDSGASRPFRVPGVPVVPILGILFCVLLMTGLPFVTWTRLVVWLAIGLVIYISYGRNNSRLRHPERYVE
jgi:APA family basic amino acid/polyamine antiporter